MYKKQLPLWYVRKIVKSDAIFQPYLVVYGGQFPQPEKQIVPGSEPAAFC